MPENSPENATSASASPNFQQVGKGREAAEVRILAFNELGGPTTLEYGTPTSLFKKRKRGSNVTAPELVMESGEPVPQAQGANLQNVETLEPSLPGTNAGPLLSMRTNSLGESADAVKAVIHTIAHMPT